MDVQYICFVDISSII